MKKVCILGSANSFKYAPFDKDCEIWILNNNLYKQVPRFDRQFDVHVPHCYDPRGEYREFLINCGEKLYILDESKELPQANIIDYRLLIRKYGHYFTSSFAYMLALAIEEKYTHISLYGCECNVKSEYETQRACIEYFLGIAKGKGLNVFIHPASKLLKSERLYGYV